jgi:hypothetical protein
MMRLTTLAVVGVVTLSLVALAPPAAATHAYTCDISDDPLVRNTYCGVHCTWDAFTGAQFKNILACFGFII